ncbi:MAG: amidase [Geodermatophilaceae bacterium]|nr:amidase [Geodermatophilaceae bacterium]MDQ3466105.1 amidase [Actinomycetota bacterium]
MLSTVRRGLLAFTLVAASLVATTGPVSAAPAQTLGAGTLAGLDMERVTIPQLQAAMNGGRLSSAGLTSFYLDRINRIDPLVNAILALNGNALSQAADSDRVRRTSGPRSLLEGIPVLLKDNIDTADQGATAGSEALLASRPDDAALVQRLRAAGAVIIGKANLSEWANFRGFDSTSGWSAVGGQTNNPYVLDRNPCGSSSGSGAGVAASLAVVAIGTETDGSIVCPAGQTGVVGHKPTLGLVSGDGIVPISHEQDTAGPMARNVTDAAIVLDVIDRVNQDYTDALDPDALSGARIGVWSSVTGDTSPDVDALFAQTVDRLRRLGATTVEVEPPYLDKVGNNEFPALLVEFAHDIDVYLAETPGAHPEDLAGLIAFNEARAETELQYFGQEIFEAALATGGDLTDPRYQRARTVATAAAQRSIDETLARYDLDAIVAPTNSPAWETTLGEGDAFLFGSSSPAAVSGYPNVSVPMGYIGPLPIGMSVFAGAGDDAAVLGLAFAWEQATQVRRAPTYRATLG